MTFRKRTKNSRQRGSWTHGWGAKKKHRGAGSRGGRGNAGSGKRGDKNKPTMIKIGRVFGKNGFSSHANGNGSLQGINVDYFDAVNIAQHKGVEVKKDVVVVDLEKMGYDKLLGSGKVVGKYEITANYATPSAVKKIEAAGGKVTVLKAAEQTAQDEA